MKGNPALRTVLVLLLLAAVAYPVSRVISHTDHPAPSPATATPATQPSLLSGTLNIKTAPAPLRIEVTSGGKVILLVSQPKELSEITKEISLPYGSDLLVRADWQDDQHHALHAEFLSHGTNAPVSHDYWSGRTLEDVLSLP